MSAPDPHLIRTLEEILAHAREGRITSIAIALAGPETHAHSAEWHISGDDRELALIRTQLGGLCYDIDKTICEMARRYQKAYVDRGPCSGGKRL